MAKQLTVIVAGASLLLGAFLVLKDPIFSGNAVSRTPVGAFTIYAGYILVAAATFLLTLWWGKSTKMTEKKAEVTAEHFIEKTEAQAEKPKAAPAKKAKRVAKKGKKR